MLEHIRDGQNLESDWSQSLAFFVRSEWSRSAFFVNLLESEWSLVSNFKIEIKIDASVKCD